jgi:hypothetical protein
MQNCEQKKKVKKSEKPRFYEQNKLFFENPALQPLGSFSSLVQKKKWKKNYFSSHKLPKQQSTSFWSQGILGVKRANGCGTKLCYKLMIYVGSLSQRKKM